MDPMTAQKQIQAYITPACTTLGNVIGWLATPKVRRTATPSLATWNINSIYMYKPRYVCILMLQDSIEVVVLIDPRHSATGLKAYVQVHLESLGAGTAVYGSADAPRKTVQRGGIIKNLGPRWGQSYKFNASKTDKYAQGVLPSVTLRTTTGSLIILANYWPSVAEHGHVSEHVLWTRVHAFPIVGRCP